MTGLLSILIAAFAFSFYPLLNSIALQHSSPFALALLVQVGTIICSTLFLTTKVSPFQRIIGLFRDYKKLPLDILIVPILSGIAIYLGGLFFLFALITMSKAGAALIMETWPIIAIFLAPLLIYKKWKKFKALDSVLIVLSLLGLLMITGAESKITLSEFYADPLHLFSNQDTQGYIGILIAFLSALCFAWASLLRTYFANMLPNDFRIKHFGKIESIKESIFTYLLTYIVGLPFAIISFLIMESDFQVEGSAFVPVIFISLSLTVTSSLYSHALLKSDNANINLLWYISPVLAAVWLALFGYSQITEMLIVGGGLIILANIILILTSKNSGEKQ